MVDALCVFGHPSRLVGADTALRALTMLKNQKGSAQQTPASRERVGLICAAAGLAGVLTILTLPRETCAMQTQEEIDARLYNVPDYYLAKMGPKLGVHFTTEYLEGADTFVETTEALNPNVSTLNELIKELEKKIDARVVLDRKDKDHPIIHLIDKALLKKSEVLDRKIDLSYSGIVGDVAEELERRGVPGIEPPRSGGNTDFFNDHVTKVSIDAKQEPLRDILTHSVDLKKYNWLIWTAKTYQTGTGEWKTQIRFTGPKPVGRAAP